VIARATTPATLALALAVVGAGGTIAAVLVAAGSGWTELTVSQLSADAAAGPWFRATMLACGLIALGLAARVWAVLGALRSAGIMGAGWAALHRLGFVVIGLGFIGVAAFPLGVGPFVELAHGTAAYAIPIAVLVLMLTAPLAVRALGDRFGRASLVAIAAILLLYAAAVLGLVPYAPMELAGFAIGGGWLVWYVIRLDRLAGSTAGR
jgi:hypothetical protein